MKKFASKRIEYYKSWEGRTQLGFVDRHIGAEWIPRVLGKWDIKINESLAAVVKRHVATREKDKHRKQTDAYRRRRSELKTLSFGKRVIEKMVSEQKKMLEYDFDKVTPVLDMSIALEKNDHP